MTEHAHAMSMSERADELEEDRVTSGGVSVRPVLIFLTLVVLAYGALSWTLRSDPELAESLLRKLPFISSLTGKSPSTTGFGSEGALTKGPFNALPAIIDLNAALLSFVLTGYDGWVSCAGYVGPKLRAGRKLRGKQNRPNFTKPRRG